MTISLPGSTGKGFGGIFRRKTDVAAPKPTAKKNQLNAQQVAKLFDKKARAEKPVKPAKLSETEVNARNQLSSLRGALYSDD